MTKSTSIEVREIHCSSCENTIKTALETVEGVRLVLANSADNRVKVTFEEEKVSESVLREKLAEIGYEPIVTT